MSYYKHGHAKNGKPTRIYFVWRNMRARCIHPSSPRFKDYGGRGIKICARWDKFENFLADMGEPPSPGLAIDRINNDGDYEPGNVRWASRSVSMRNRRPGGPRRSPLTKYTTAELKAELVRRRKL